MVPIHREPHREGELLLGWPTWDPTGQKYKRMSVKYSYPDRRGRPSRGAPEVPMETLVAMLKVALRHQQIRPAERVQLKKLL